MSYRITPARAGKSGGTPLNPPCAEDHPRACGEKLQHILKWNHRPGSPPRVRGKDDPIDDGAPQLGITPARAGKRFNQPLMP